MRRLLLFAVMLILALAVSPVSAAPAAPKVLYVDDDGVCGGNTPCYAHPQDAVNAATVGARIRVYPGRYGSRFNECPWAPNCSCGDTYAPALIVYKDRLTIEATDPDPANTVIEATHDCWSTPIAVKTSTAGGVNPVFGSEPNAISIIASRVVLKGFTVLRPYSDKAGGHSTILIGGLYGGYGSHGEALGFRSNTVSGCVLGGGSLQNRNGVGVWHSADNVITGNTIIDPQWWAIGIYDGYSDEEVGLPSPSTGNRVSGNRITDDPDTWSLGQAVSVGAWNVMGPTGVWTDNTGTKVYDNDCGGMGLYTAYSFGAKKFYHNTNVGWTGYYQATDWSFKDNAAPQVLVPDGMRKLQVGPPR